MTAKQLRFAKMITAFVVAMTVSQSILTNNYLTAAIAIAIAILVMFWLRSRVKEIIADERDFAIGGIAARWAIQMYSWAAVIAMLLLYNQRAINPYFEVVASTLAYSTCVLMVMYSLFYRYNSRLKFMSTNLAYVVLGILLLLAITLLGVRLFSGEDNWICDNGQWVEHGHPDFPAPKVPCAK